MYRIVPVIACNYLISIHILKGFPSQDKRWNTSGWEFGFFGEESRCFSHLYFFGGYSLTLPSTNYPSVCGSSFCEFVLIWCFFGMWLGWDEAQNHLTSMIEATGRASTTWTTVYDIRDLMKKRNKTPPFSIGKYIHLHPFLFSWLGLSVFQLLCWMSKTKSQSQRFTTKKQLEGKTTWNLQKACHF